MTLPPAGARLASPVSLPGEASPSGPIVAAYTTYSTYTVQAGDTLNRVATQFGVGGDVISRTSGLSDPNLLLPGQVLTIPRDTGWLYRVQPDDTLDLIALRFSLSRNDLLDANGLDSPSVRAGDLLFIPNRGQTAPKQ
jgi:N-acetylmuramoyl-L-alanine amidase